MLRKSSILDYLMYVFLFVCIFASDNWTAFPSLTQAELFRFDKVLLFGQVNIYHLFALVFFLIILLTKLSARGEKTLWGERNYLKNIFWMYFIPVNILVYFTIYIKNIKVQDLGVVSLAKFFVFLVITLYVQDVFLENKSGRELSKILTVLEVLILIRCAYSIIKHILGLGVYVSTIGRIRIGQENDFADFFILLFIIAAVRLFFNVDERKGIRFLHITGLAMTIYVVILSFRRYLWIEFIVAIGLIMLIYSTIKRIHSYKVVASSCFVISFGLSLVLFLGPNRLVNNLYVGRLLTSLSIIDVEYESEYGTQMGHYDEISEGWYNVKKNWLLGVSPYGKKIIQRFKTKSWQQGLYVHNAFLGIWLVYGLLGLILFLFLYIKSLQLGYRFFFKSNNTLGLILFVFLICQIAKNIVWQTAITLINVTVIYIFLISIVLRARRLDETAKNEVMREATQ